MPLASIAYADATLTLAWDQSQESDVIGYRVHYGIGSRNYQYSVDVGNQTSCSISGLNEGTTYYIAATAYDNSNNESNFSEEINKTIPNPPPPPPPVDTDGDGILDSDETSVYGTDPNKADTDGDGMNDGEELAFWGNNWSNDTDGDGLVNLVDPDMDGDGYPDSVEINTGFDPSDPASKPEYAQIWLEAEEGSLNEPMSITADDAASAGEYIMVPRPGNSNNLYPLAKAGYAEVTFQVPAAGEYIVWGRVNSADTATDSLFVSMDGGEYYPWATQVAGDWVWDQVTGNLYDGVEPVIFNLTAGEHRLIFKQREPGTKLDKILITNNHALSPAGMGEEAPQPLNKGPITPSITDGPSSGYPQTGYSFSTASSDPDGDTLEYRFDWGDGSTSDWGASSVSHSWDSTGSFCIKSQARDYQGAVSNWSACHHITINEITYTISASATTNGSITPSGQIAVVQGASQTFKIFAAQNYEINDVLIDNNPVGPVASYTFNDINGNHSIEAQFVLKNQAPAANAGPDQTVNQGVILRLSGAGSSDPDDGLASYSWVQTGGPTVSLSNPEASETVFVSPYLSTAGEELSFVLTVKDHAGLSSEDTCIVNITGITENDSDQDGIGDKFDNCPNSSNPGQVDSDGDGVGDVCDPFSNDSGEWIDTDGDGKGNNADPDDDNDGVADTDEINIYGTDPYNFDSDEDGFYDGEEIANGSNPSDANSLPESVKIWLEAEKGYLNEPMSITADDAASAGEYALVPRPGNSNNLDPLANAAGYVEFTFQVPAVGEYIVWGRVNSVDTATDSFFVSMDGGEYYPWATQVAGDWVWDQVTGNLYDGVEPVIFNLTAGEHRLIFKQREPGTKLDQILITNDLEYMPQEVATTEPITIRLEAENGYLNKPMTIAADDAASAGEYVLVPRRRNRKNLNPLANAGYVEFTFQVPAAGEYLVWGRVLSVDGGSNSFFVSIDNAEYGIWHTQISTNWIWDQVSSSNVADPIVTHLEAGEHTLIIKHREQMTKIDKILITNDMDYIPN